MIFQNRQKVTVIDLLLAFRMGGKLENLEFKKRNYVPGPGTHNPEKRHDIPSMKFGTG